MLYDNSSIQSLYQLINMKQPHANEPRFDLESPLTESLIEIEDIPDILGNLDEEEKRKAIASGQLKHYEKGDFIFQQGEAHNGIHLIESGRIRSFYVSEAGKEVTLAYWTKGHFVGAPQMFGGGQHLWTSVAVEKCSTIWLPGKVLRGLISELPNLAYGIIEGLAHKSACYAQLLQVLATSPMASRLARLLLALANRSAEMSEEELQLSRNFTHEELANMVGSTRQWVSSTLEKFEKDGLIVRKGQSLVILDPVGLEQRSI